MAGNMRMPVSFGSGAPCRSLGAVTRNAAVQETVKVSAKYETPGCWQIKEDLVAEVDGESMVNEGCYSSRPRGTMSEFSNELVSGKS